MSDIKVYIVEDGALIRECLRAMLDLEQDVKVVGEAASAEEALQELKTLDVDLVLLDIGLPGMDGITAAATLKNRDPRLPVLMLTSHENGYAADALRAGASGYILKSCTRQQLIQAIRTACDNQVPIDAAIAADLLGNTRPHTEASKDPNLTERQVDILKLAATRAFSAPEEALQELKTLDVDLVLLDIGLPGMDGITAAATLKNRDPRLPVLMLTSHENGYAADALRAGASGYILKSCTRQQLIQAIRTACDNQVPIDAAIAADLLGNTRPHTEASKDPNLTERQVDILKLAATRVPYKDIATNLSINETTVSQEMRKIFDLRPWLFRDRITSQANERRRTKVQ